MSAGIMQTAKYRTVIFVMAAVITCSVIDKTAARKADHPRCLQPIKETIGSCHNGIVEQRWGFDSATGRCVKFWYASCYKNKNNFETPRKCLETCKRDSQCLKKPKKSWWNWLKLFNTFYFDVDKVKCLERKTPTKQPAKRRTSSALVRNAKLNVCQALL
uniref:Putative serine proteinase inhibitor n=1 Tax=Rhipicephalus microplus TaxID=6941 RepID=A0A6G5A7H9_RHIMP